MARRGRKSAAQTPAPKKERIYGSKKNPPGSASGEGNIKFSNKIVESLKKKLSEFQEIEKNPKITLNDLKAVYRRGLGAYSSTHRPTITGGMPNTRNAWAMARVNKFLKKASGEKVKAAYVQDDDLLKYENGGQLKDKNMYQIKDENGKFYSLSMNTGKPNWNDSPDLGYTFQNKDEAEQLMKKLNLYGLSVVEYDKDWWKKMENGGNVGEEISCVNCGWEWNSLDSEENDKYVCHKCGFDNSLFYTSFKDTKTPEELSELHNVSLRYINTQLEEGAKHETEEHTKKGVNLGEIVGKTIALHHLEERPDYYEKIKLLEKEPIDKPKDYEIYEKEPIIEEIYSIYFVTPGHTEIYDFVDLPEAVNFTKNVKNDFVIRDYDGKKVMTKSDVSKFLNGEKKLQEFKKGGNLDGRVHNNIPEFLNEQRDEAESVLFSRKSQIMKNMICNAYIQNAEKEIKQTNNPIEQNVYNEVINIWKETKSQISDLVFMYENGGDGVGCGCTKMAKGGLAYGNSHDKGGMPMVVKSTGQNIEIEGGEGVVNKRSMQMTKKVEFQGKMLTPCEVISKINEMGGGVKFKCDDVKEIIKNDGQYD